MVYLIHLADAFIKSDLQGEDSQSGMLFLCESKACEAGMLTAALRNTLTYWVKKGQSAPGDSGDFLAGQAYLLRSFNSGVHISSLYQVLGGDMGVEGLLRFSVCLALA